MKRILLIAFIAIVFNLVAKSQDFKYGIRFGINTSNIELVGLQIGGINNYDGINKIGICLGSFLEYRIKSWSFSGELQYSEQGAKFDNLSTGIGIQNKSIDLNYLSFSPLVKLYIFKCLNIQAGWHFNYNVFGNKNMDANVNIYNDVTGVYVIRKQQYKIANWNQGLVTGIEFDLLKHFLVTYRSYLFNSSIIESDVLGLGVSNYVSQISFAYKF